MTLKVLEKKRKSYNEIEVINKRPGKPYRDTEEGISHRSNSNSRFRSTPSIPSLVPKSTRQDLEVVNEKPNQQILI